VPVNLEGSITGPAGLGPGQNGTVKLRALSRAARAVSATFGEWLLPLS
jgi:hypothetical protein